MQGVRRRADLRLRDTPRLRCWRCNSAGRRSRHMPDPLARAALLPVQRRERRLRCHDGQPIRLLRRSDEGLLVARSSAPSRAGCKRLAECLQLCSSCDRCHHISVSRNFADCSWYSACNTSALLKLGNHRSGRMTPRLRAVASATAEEHPESTPQLLRPAHAATTANDHCGMATEAGNYLALRALSTSTLPSCASS